MLQKGVAVIRCFNPSTRKGDLIQKGEFNYRRLGGGLHGQDLAVYKGRKQRREDRAVGAKAPFAQKCGSIILICRASCHLKRTRKKKTGGRETELEPFVGVLIIIKIYGNEK